MAKDRNPVAMTPWERTENVMSQAGLTYGGTGGQRGQTIAEYFSGIRRKRDEDRRRERAARLAMAEEAEWLGLPEVADPAPPPEAGGLYSDPDEKAWAAMMRAKGWVEESPGNWVSPKSAAANLMRRSPSVWSPW